MQVNKSKHCLNCNHEINESNYCQNCGQLNSDKKLSIKQILKDFIGDYFTFDSKFFRSIFPLLIKPGRLTQEYLNGKRTHYILPFRLYIFTTFVFFFVLTLNTKIDFDKFSHKQQTGIGEKIPDTTSVNNSSLESKINTELNKNIYPSIDSKKNKNKDDLKGKDYEFTLQDTTIASSPFLTYIVNKSRYISNLGDKGSDIFVKEIINQVPKLMFILLPIFALLLKLIYFRQKILYVEHLVFSLHIHTFFFLILLLTIFFTNTYLIGILIFVTLIYLLLSIINFYQQTVFKSFIKFVILTSLYMISLIPALALLMFIAFLSI